jgi:hypothetical protein
MVVVGGREEWAGTLFVARRWRGVSVRVGRGVTPVMGSVVAWRGGLGGWCDFIP